MGTNLCVFPKLKITYREGRVHSNVDPVSRLKRCIPFFENKEVQELSTTIRDQKGFGSTGTKQAVLYNTYHKWKQYFHSAQKTLRESPKDMRRTLITQKLYRHSANQIVNFHNIN
jgi:hypothetical protein